MCIIEKVQLEFYTKIIIYTFILNNAGGNKEKVTKLCLLKLVLIKRMSIYEAR